MTSTAGVSRAITPLQTLLAVFLWITGIVDIFADIRFLDDIRLGALIMFIALAVFLTSRLTRIVAMISAISAIVYFHYFQTFTPVIDGLRFALVFTIFLPALVLTREVVETSPEIAQARSAFSELSAANRSTGLVIGSQLLGAVLTLGVMAVTAPLVSQSSPEPERRSTLLNVLQGLMLGGLWTPFSVAVVYILNFRPELSLAELLIPGFCMAVVGTLVAIMLAAGPRGLTQIPSALRVFKPLMPMIFVAIVGVLVAAWLLPFSTIQTVALVMPVLCGIKLMMIGPFAARGALGNVFSRIGSTGNEMLLFSAAVVLGYLVQSSGLSAHLVTLLALDRNSVVAAIVVLVMIGPVLALTGMHSVLIGTLLIAIMSPVSDRIPDIIEGQILIFGWMSGAIVSLGSLSVGLGTRLFRVSVARTIISTNLLFTAVFAACVAAVLVLCNGALTAS